jgi:hypothetical protein
MLPANLYVMGIIIADSIKVEKAISEEIGVPM